MPGEIFIRRAAERCGEDGNLFELYAWFFMRLSGLILLGMAVFHLIYMQFIIPGGVTHIDYDIIVTRWANPGWRLFDLLLLLFALTHGVNGLRRLLEKKVYNASRRGVTKAVLFFAWFLLLVMGNAIIFSFIPQ